MNSCSVYMGDVICDLSIRVQAEPTSRRRWATLRTLCSSTKTRLSVSLSVDTLLYTSGPHY